MGIKWECIKNFLKKPFTRRYPKEKLVPYSKFKGKIEFLPKKCIGCKMCVINCPSNAITFHKKGVIEFDMGKCCFCGFCRDICPTNAILFTTQFEYATKDKKKLIVK